MPLTPEAIEDSIDFQHRKKAQWETFCVEIPGLQLIRTNNNSSWMLVCSQGDFYEGVIIGQLEQSMGEMKGPARARVRRELPNAKKPIEKRGIDMTDEEISKVIKRWKSGKSAAGLKFVPCVWGRDGQPVSA